MSEQQRLEQPLGKLRSELIPVRATAAPEHNGAVINGDESLCGVPAANGEVPPGFPKTRRAAKFMSGEQLGALLKAYGMA
jgi:hypothetical protein